MIKTREELLRVIPVIDGFNYISMPTEEENYTDPRQQSLHCWEFAGQQDFYTGPSVGSKISLEEAIEIYNKLHFNEEFIEKI